MEKWTQQQAEAAAAATKQSESELKSKHLQQFEKNERSILPTSSVPTPAVAAAAAAAGAVTSPTAVKKPPPGYIAVTGADGKAVFVVDKEKVKEHSVSTKDLTPAQREERKKYLPSFWIPAVCVITRHRITASHPPLHSTPLHLRGADLSYDMT